MRQDSYIQQIYERICDAKPQTAFVILDFCDLTDYDTAKKSLLRLEEKEKYSVLYVVFITILVLVNFCRNMKHRLLMRLQKHWPETITGRLHLVEMQH